jgi:Uma2 family endonuclease
MAYRAHTSRQLTLSEYLALPDDDAWLDEVSHGYLIREPAPGNAHARLVSLITYRLMQYEEQHPGCGRVYAEGGVILADDPLTVRRPDVAFVRQSRVPPRESQSIFRGAPDLAIEVLSPSNRPSEILTKVAEFLEAGTPAVWVIDSARKLATVHDNASTTRVLAPPAQLQLDELLPGFSLYLSTLFSDY